MKALEWRDALGGVAVGLIFLEPRLARKMSRPGCLGQGGARRKPPSGWEDSKHGCLHELFGAIDRLFPGCAPSPATQRLAEASARRPDAVAPVLAGDSEPGRSGAAGSLPAIDPGLLLDASESAPDDGDPLVGFLRSVPEDRQLRGLPVCGDGPLGFSEQQCRASARFASSPMRR